MIEIIINEKSLTAESGKTILEVAKENGIRIPTLCNSEKVKPLGSCGVCAVEVIDETNFVKSCETIAENGMNIFTDSDEVRAERKRALEVILSDHYADCEAPCKVACPDHVDIQTYLAHIAKGQHQEAVEVIKETLPMPLSIGRVCPAFCEFECRRTLVEEPIAIRQLKRHAADYDIEEFHSFTPPKDPATGKKIAIVGGGPSGLTCGYYLSNLGHEATVFESAPEAGGWLRYGIPEFRLPKEILDKEIDLMCANGMKIKTNSEIGRKTSIEYLSKNYDAVYIAIGAQKAVPMRFPGTDLSGCFLGVDFLKDVVLGKDVKVGKNVAVIGGGNTAIDCVRTARRLGAEVTLVYRRTRKEMPAEEYEVDAAEEEGIKLIFLTNPVENIGENGKLTAIKLEKMQLGKPDESGRRRPQPTGEFFTQKFDTVIGAISQKPDVDFLDEEHNKLAGKKIPLTDWNTVKVNEKTMYSGLSNVFAGGDFRLGPSTAIEAIADGKIASQSIHRYLNDEFSEEIIELFDSKKAKKLHDVDSEQYDEYIKKARAKMPELIPEIRASNFEEVETGYEENIARAEAERCLSCGCYVNTTCDLRNHSTEYKAEQVLEEGSYGKYHPDFSSEFILVDRNKCMNCGLCVAGCNETVVNEVINWGNPEEKTEIMFNDSFLMGSSLCVQCGECVQMCPVGALIDVRPIGQGRTADLEMIETVCGYCGVGCRTEVHIDRKHNKIVRVEGVEDSVTNEGMLCVKGRYGFDFINSKERLTTPLIKENGKFREASWKEATSLIAGKFNAIIAENGGDALAGMASARATNEDNYAFQKFFKREVGTNSIDHCARL